MDKQKLAYEIATALDDMDSIVMHLKFVEQYSEEYLRKKLMKALAIKEEDVRVSRGAIYTSLVQGKHAKFRPRN